MRNVIIAIVGNTIPSTFSPTNCEKIYSRGGSTEVGKSFSAYGLNEHDWKGYARLYREKAIEWFAETINRFERELGYPFPSLLRYALYGRNGRLLEVIDFPLPNMACWTNEGQKGFYRLIEDSQYSKSLRGMRNTRQKYYLPKPKGLPEVIKTNILPKAEEGTLVVYRKKIAVVRFTSDTPLDWRRKTVAPEGHAEIALTDQRFRSRTADRKYSPKMVELKALKIYPERSSFRLYTLSGEILCVDAEGGDVDRYSVEETNIYEPQAEAKTFDGYSFRDLFEKYGELRTTPLDCPVIGIAYSTPHVGGYALHPNWAKWNNFSNKKNKNE